MLKLVRMLVIAAVALTVAGVTPAFAAAPTWQTIDVTVHSEQGQSLLLVTGQLPEGTKLPVEAELAVPAGMQVQWMGEILGGPVSEDPELQGTKTTANGMDLYKFTLTKAPVAQIEGTLPGLVTSDGTNFTSALKWTAWRELPEVRLAHRIPQSAQLTAESPGATTAPGDTGFKYYTKTVKNTKAGDVLDLNFTYTIPAGAATTPANTGSSNSDSTVIVLVIGGILAFAAVLALNAKRRGDAAAQAALEAEEAEKPAPASKAAKKKAAEQVVVAGEPESEEFEAEYEEETVAAERQPSSSGGKKPTLVVVAVVVGVFLVGFAIAGNRGTSADVVGGKITRNFGSQSACQFASFPLTPKQGVDLSKEGQKVVDSFDGQAGIGEVTLDLERSAIDVGFCSSNQTQETVQQLLASSGLVDVGTPVPAAAPAGAPPAVEAPATGAPATGAPAAQ